MSTRASCGLYCKHILMIVSDVCTINVSLVFALALASVANYDQVMLQIVYDRHYDDRNCFIIQATGHFI